jgi:hypothetical protein
MTIHYVSLVVEPVCVWVGGWVGVYVCVGVCVCVCVRANDNSECVHQDV